MYCTEQRAVDVREGLGKEALLGVKAAAYHTVNIPSIPTPFSETEGVKGPPEAM